MSYKVWRFLTLNTIIISGNNRSIDERSFLEIKANMIFIRGIDNNTYWISSRQLQFELGNDIFLSCYQCAVIIKNWEVSALKKTVKSQN